MGAFESDNRPTAGIQAIERLPMGYALAYSSGIRKIKHIAAFLNVAGVVSPWQANRHRLQVSCVVVWGRKQNSRQALRYASINNLPVRYVEDGWVRSCSANPHSRLSYSLLVDEQGVYYDSSAPSALESYLNLPDAAFSKLCGERELAHAKHCRKLLTNNDITKYNYVRAPEQAVLHRDNRPLVLVLDQTLDDASVRFGSMDKDLFNAMLDEAVQENPDARVVVRTHPDVVAGRRQGYLQLRAQELDVEISAAGDNPIPWLKAASRVYVGTSQLGYEALLCECKVKVYGQPFYAGWGLTEDCQPIKRRTRTHTIDQLFHATHVHYARYCCPVTGQPWSLQDCLEHVALQQQYFKRNTGNYVAVGFTPWKRRYLAQFLRSPEARLRFSTINDAGVDETIVRWSYSEAVESKDKQHNAVSVTNINSVRCVRVEDGFLRSRGLGSDFAAPASLVFDKLALYFDASTSSELENLLNGYHCSAAEIARAVALRRRLLATNLTKYNVGTLNQNTFAKPRRVSDQKTILVVGQVAGDQSLLRGGGDVSSNTELIKLVKNSNPDALIVYKPHPDVVSGNRDGIVAPDVISACIDRIETTRHLLDCLKECDELHTMTSLSGFEALLRGTPVVTYGLPFYAGWGLTKDFHQCKRRTAVRSLDELVYLCLILYPHYVDLASGEFISVEQLIDTLLASSNDCPGTSGIRWVRKLSNIAASLAYQAE